MSERIKRTAMGWTVEASEPSPVWIKISYEDPDGETLDVGSLSPDVAEGLLWTLQMALNDLKRKEDRANG